MYLSIAPFGVNSKILFPTVCANSWSCVVNNTEPLKLFNELLKSASVDDFNEIIEFLYSKGETNKKDCDKVIVFWNELYNRIENEESFSQDKEKLLANTVKMGKFIIQIDENTFQLLLAGARESQKNYTACILLDELGRLVENKPNKPKYIAEIFKAMCNGEFYLLDYDEKLTTIYKFLLVQNESEIINIAEDINDIYLSKSNEIFKELWEQYKRGVC